MSWLESKYIHLCASSLSLFKQTNTNTWNFRCPLCGDSESDSTKCRGYIFYDSAIDRYRYKCHKCGESILFTTLLKTINQDLFHDYKLEYIKEMGFSKKRPTIKQHTVKKKKPKISNKDVPKLLLNLECVDDLPIGHLVRKYVAARKIPKSEWSRLYWSTKMKDVADMLDGYDDTYFDPHPRLLLPFIAKDGVLSHIQGRGIGDDVSKGSRYYTLECESGYPKIFGLDKIDNNLTTYVVEGPIDSLFLDNCVGMGGSDLPWGEFSPDTTVFIFDNEPRSPIITKKMADAYKRGFGLCVWSNNIHEKDINDIVKSGKSKPWLMDYISTHTYRGLKAKMALSKYAIKR